jgi:hypothetical protein
MNAKSSVLPMLLLCRQEHGIHGGFPMLAELIGEDRRKAAEILRRHGLTPFRAILTPELFRQAHSAEPSPRAVLIPEVVFWLMATAALAAGSMAGCISVFWAPSRAAMPWLPVKAVTEEAFSIARKMLPIRFFLRVFQVVVDRFCQKYSQAYRWKGRRLLGIDGMDMDLPKNLHLSKIFPPPENRHGTRAHPQARLVGLVGLWDGVCHAFRWTSLRVGEQFSARKLLSFLGPGDLLLADRNFPDKETFAGILAQGADFLFHLPSNRFLKLARSPVPHGNHQEWTVRIPLPAPLRRRYPSLGKELQVRVLQYQIAGYRPSWLVTSLLDAVEFPAEELVEVYHERWRQETRHREWKHTLELSNLRSLSAAGLLKEVLVQLTMSNVIRWIMAEAAPPALRPVDFKFLEVKRLILASLPAMAAAPVVMLPGLYQDLLKEIARQRIRVRPGRSYPRKWDAKARPKGHGKTAAPAKLPSTTEKGHAPI